MTKRSRFLIGLLLGCAIGIGGVTYAVWTSLYDEIMTSSEAMHINVEEMSGTNPLQLKIKVVPMGSAPVIRSVTTKRHGQVVTVLYHLALSGLVKPRLGWQDSYLLTVPDSVREVRFGRDSEVIWQRRM